MKKILVVTFLMNGEFSIVYRIYSFLYLLDLVYDFIIMVGQGFFLFFC